MRAPIPAVNGRPGCPAQSQGILARCLAASSVVLVIFGFALDARSAQPGQAAAIERSDLHFDDWGTASDLRSDDRMRSAKDLAAVELYFDDWNVGSNLVAGQRFADEPDLAKVASGSGNGAALGILTRDATAVARRNHHEAFRLVFAPTQPRKATGRIVVKQ